ncbi:MAG: DNA repair protein RecO [Firmicutes bacterium]|nr:DNA repair protein RecO [Bacillota bacterium]
MDIRDTTIDAIILKARNYKEQDKLLTYFSLEQGKGVAIARGACKPGASLSGVAQPFVRASLTLGPPKGGVSYVTQAMPDTSFITLDSPLGAIAYASYFSELTDLALPERRPSPDFFALLLTVFTMLKMDDDTERTARYFELALLAELGLLPSLDSCAGCGRSLRDGQFRLSPKRGALLCYGCGGDDPAPPLCAGTVLTMKRLLEAPISKLASIKISPAIMKEMEAACSYFLDYHLDYSAKAKKVLHQLLD